MSESDAPLTTVPATASVRWLRSTTGVGWTLAIVAFALSASTLRHPGLTVDEPINVGHGRAWVDAFLASPASVWRRDVVYALWVGGHEHPPLTRWTIGWSDFAFGGFFGEAEENAPCGGRLASSFAYAGIVGLCGVWGSRLAGPIAGWSSGVAALLSPRLFGHSRLASPEVISAFFFLLALGALASAVRDRRSVVGFSVAGLALGLALLSKLTGMLVVVAGAPIAVAYLGKRGLAPIACWMSVGSATFVLGWPWLWPFDFPGYSPGWMGSWERAWEFARTGVERAPIYAWYFGRQYPNADGPAPASYVWVYAVATVPVGLQILGVGWGVASVARRARRDAGAGALLACLATILVAFTLPIARYDGDRLFLMAFPLWAIVVGVGADAATRCLRRWLPNGLAIGVVGLWVLSQAPALWRDEPCQLSYYNCLFGGLAGADRLGLEATYWGDSLTVAALDAWAAKCEPGERAALFPTLYEGHARALSSPGMRGKRLQVAPGDQLAAARCRYALLFHRQSYVNDPLPTRIREEGEIVVEVAREGVWLTRVYRLPDGFSP